MKHTKPPRSTRPAADQPSRTRQLIQKMGGYEAIQSQMMAVSGMRLSRQSVGNWGYRNYIPTHWLGYMSLGFPKFGADIQASRKP